MVGTQLRLTARPHRNQQLFSDHYLDTILPSRADWRLGEAAAAATLAKVARIVAAFVPSTIEAQTEKDLIQPVLEALGHTFEVQPSLRVPGGTNTPDYVFYPDADAVAANKGRILDEQALHGALAVGDAKVWDRPLDRAIRTGADPFDNKNPSYQISFYMQHSGLPWGILTNGRLWRLYHKDTAHKLDRFYEVDLPALVEAGDAAGFQYFSGFFGRAAFSAGPVSLDALLAASMDYARGVSEGLKQQVYDALRHLAQGFLDYPANGLAPDPTTLKAIYDNALILLYRLLFILYAEARGLLPLQSNPDYRHSYSLDALKKEIANSLHRPLLPRSGTLWPRLLELFRIINEGEPPLGVTTFNGGLFDPARHPFLTRFTVGDAHLRQALDKLSRVDGQFVDFRDLAEQHLGTIYEGLLEFQLRPLATPTDGWTVELVTSKGERKVSGSYYTPGFITRSMVEQTVGPVVEAALTRTAADGPAAQVQAVLSLNVLDCSMGSGHFLVEATEYIARRLVAAGLLPMDLWALPQEGGAPPFNELAYWKRRVAQSCVYGVDLNPLAVDLAKLSLWLSTAAAGRPLSFLDHHLRPGNALAGAWLEDLVLPPDAADEKRRRRAAKEAAARQAAGQLSWFTDDTFRRSVSVAVDSMWRIEGSPAATIADVHAQEAAYAQLREQLAGRYGRLADLATALRFGLSVDTTLWQPLAAYATGSGLTAPRAFDAWLAEADAHAARWRFFHWELEFPEVFFDRAGHPLGEQAGFDVVIGNPPYVRQEELGPLKTYLASAFPETYHGIADLYVYFFNQGLRLTGAGGRMSYIVTNKWLRAGYGEPLRAYFAAQGALDQLIDFGHAPIFPDADVFPCIVLLEKPTPQPANGGPPERSVRVVTFPRELLHQVDLDEYVREHSHIVPSSRFGRAPWSLDSVAVSDLLAKMRQVGVPLRDVAGTKPYWGLKTGLNEAFVVDTQTKDRLIKADAACTRVIKPYVRGQDMARWVPDWADTWLIVLKSSGDHPWPWSVAGEDAEEIFRDTFPSLHQHLKPWEEKLRRRQDQGRYWWELRSCAYYDAFERPKIFYPDITWRSQFSLDSDGRVCNNTVYFLPADSPWLLTVLNSPLLWSFCWREAVHGKDEALRFFTEFVERIPIAPASDDILGEVAPAVERLRELARGSAGAPGDARLVADRVRRRGAGAAAAAVCVVGCGNVRRGGPQASAEAGREIVTRGAAGSSRDICGPGRARATGSSGGAGAGAAALRSRQSGVRADVGRGGPTVGNRPTPHTSHLMCRRSATSRHGPSGFTPAPRCGRLERSRR